MLELMARGAMRVGEVLKIVPNDVSERKILLRDPKSGRENEMIFIPQKVADRLREYIESQNIGLHERIFPICYEAARLASILGHMICDGMLPPMHPGQAYHWRL